MSVSNLQIRDANVEDLSAVTAIYNYYVEHSIATLFQQELTEADLRLKFEAAQARGYAFLVAEREGKIIGFAYCTDFRPHDCYCLPECTIFLANGTTRQGVGRKLFGALLDRMRRTGVPGVVSVITGGNNASGSLHQYFGFHLAGVLSRVARKQNRMLDVELWQLHF